MKQKKNNKSIRSSAPRCPYCGSIATLRSADGIYQNNPRESMLYVCKNYPACDAYVRVHPGTTLPMGSLANKRLRGLRMEAHKYFDQIYIRGIMSKQDAYHWLSDVLCIPFLETHIGQMGEYYCGKVIEESKKLLAQYPQFQKKGLFTNRRKGEEGHETDPRAAVRC